MGPIDSTLTTADGVTTTLDLDVYKASLISRFSNPNIKDTLLRLAEDGSQKLKTTMVPVFLEKVAQGAPIEAMALAVAGWIRFMTGHGEKGNSIDGIKDPQAGSEILKRAGEVVKAFASSTDGGECNGDPARTKVLHAFLQDYLGEDLVSRSSAVVNAVALALANIHQKGVAGVLETFPVTQAGGIQEAPPCDELRMKI